MPPTRGAGSVPRIAYKLAAVGAGAQTVDEEAEMAKEFSRLIYMRKRWRDTRKEAMRRDQYTCQSCGARATSTLSGAGKP